MATVIKIGQDSWSVDAEGYALRFNTATEAFERVRCSESCHGDPCDTLLTVDEDGPFCQNCGYYPEDEEEVL